MRTDGLAERMAGRLERGRRAAEARMLDTFDIGIPTGSWQYDEAVGKDVETITPLFTTRGYFARGSRAVSSSEVGGRTSLAETQELRIPWDSPDVPANAVAVCTEVGATTPPRQLGRRVRVNGSTGDGSQRTHYPLEVTEDLS